jgi:hypothetical protein
MDICNTSAKASSSINNHMHLPSSPYHWFKKQGTRLNIRHPALCILQPSQQQIYQSGKTAPKSRTRPMIKNRYKGSPQGVSGYSHAVSPALRYAIQLFRLKSIPPELPRKYATPDISRSVYPYSLCLPKKTIRGCLSILEEGALPHAVVVGFGVPP